MSEMNGSDRDEELKDSTTKKTVSNRKVRQQAIGDGIKSLFGLGKSEKANNKSKDKKKEADDNIIREKIARRAKIDPRYVSDGNIKNYKSAYKSPLRLVVGVAVAAVLFFGGKGIDYATMEASRDDVKAAYYQAFGKEALDSKKDAKFIESQGISQKETIETARANLNVQSSRTVAIEESGEETFAALAADHEGKIAGYLNGKTASEAREVQVSTLEGFSGFFNFDKKAVVNESNTMKNEVLIERYMALANTAAVRACQLQQDLAGKKEEDGYDKDKIEGIAESLNNVIKTVNGLNTKYDKNEITLEDLASLTSGDENTVITLVQNADRDIANLQPVQQVTPPPPPVELPDPSVDDWSDDLFNEESSSYNAKLENTLLNGLGSNLQNVVKAESAEAGVLPQNPYNEKDETLTIIFKTSNKSETQFVKVVLSGVKKGADVEQGVLDGSIKVSESKLYRAFTVDGKVYMVSSQPTYFKTVVADEDGNEYAVDKTKVSGEVYEGSFDAKNRFVHNNVEIPESGKFTPSEAAEALAIYHHQQQGLGDATVVYYGIEGVELQ